MFGILLDTIFITLVTVTLAVSVLAILWSGIAYDLAMDKKPHSFDKEYTVDDLGIVGDWLECDSVILEIVEDHGKDIIVREVEDLADDPILRYGECFIMSKKEAEKLCQVKL